jgi:hypothetical protein
MENVFKQKLYLFSDPRLQQLCEEKISLAGRDAQKLATQGITIAEILNLNARNTRFKDLPSDYELTGKIDEASEITATLAAQVRSAIRTILFRIDIQAEYTPIQFKDYKNKSLEPLTGYELLTFGKQLAVLSLQHLPELSSTSLTPAMVSTLSTICQEFDFALDKLRKANTDRDIISKERIKIGNELYEDLLNLCEKGKQAWATLSESKYNDYIIYNTPTSRPEKSSKLA